MYTFFFASIPFSIFAHIFFLSSTPFVATQIRGALSRLLLPPSPLRYAPLFSSREDCINPFLPSSARIELRLHLYPRRQALIQQLIPSFIYFSFLQIKLKIPTHAGFDLQNRVQQHSTVPTRDHRGGRLLYIYILAIKLVFLVIILLYTAVRSGPFLKRPPPHEVVVYWHCYSTFFYKVFPFGDCGFL